MPDGIVNANTVDFSGISTRGGVSSGVSNLISDAPDRGGDIIMNANSLILSAGASLLAGVSASGSGSAGNIVLNIRDTVSLQGRSSILNRLSQDAIGNGGSIDITTELLSLRNMD
jgi:hypothetical protein